MKIRPRSTAMQDEKADLVPASSKSSTRVATTPCGSAALCLLFLTTSWAALTQGTGYAIPAIPASQQSSAQTSATTANVHPSERGRADASDDGKHLAVGSTSRLHQGQHRAPTTNHPPSRAGLTSANRPKQLLDSQQRSLDGKGMNLQGPGSGKPRGAGEGELITGETVHNASASRTSGDVWTRGPSLNVVHHRGTSPPVLSGSLNADRRNNGAINGTGMNRKP
jgi:hypothetical protein